MGLSVDPNDGDVTLTRGDGGTLRFTITDATTGAPKSLAGYTAKYTVKKSIYDDITAAKFQKTVGAGITLEPGGATGVLDVVFAEADSLPLSGSHVADLELRTAGGIPETFGPTGFDVPLDVSTPGAPPAAGTVGVRFPDWIALPTFLYWKDVADGKWIKFRLSNRNMDYVSESNSEPPF